jgi:TatD DNase family protein
MMVPDFMVPGHSGGVLKGGIIDVRLIDSHAHLDMKDFDRDVDQVLSRAREGGVGHIITIGIDLSSSLAALALANRYEMISSTIGYHPHGADKVNPDLLSQLTDLAEDEQVVAWGEIGLDFFKGYSKIENQIDIFQQQLKLALDFDLPVIIHEREAHQKTYEILKEKHSSHRGVIHFFSGDYDWAMKFIELGYYLSIPGTVTYPRAGDVRDVATRIPIERLLVETDCPFAAPVPKRGKRNEPLFVSYVAEEIARLREMDLKTLAGRTSGNTMRLFGLEDRINLNAENEGKKPGNTL